MGKHIAIKVFIIFLAISHLGCTEKFAPYDQELQRLAEILGALHYLSNLCEGPNDEWRKNMEKILQAEVPKNDRKIRLYEAFNHTYRAFSQNYRFCTNMARKAKKYYKIEGQKHIHSLLNHYTNVFQ